jgi:hypothetical protein
MLEGIALDNLSFMALASNFYRGVSANITSSITKSTVQNSSLEGTYFSSNQEIYAFQKLELS